MLREVSSLPVLVQVPVLVSVPVPVPEYSAMNYTDGTGVPVLYITN